MQGLHHQQQQLAALLAAALPKDDPSPSVAAPPVPSSASSSVSASPSPSSSAPSDDDSARVSAINSLHRAILHPHNALVVSHSASFLAQGLFQLLSDKSYAVKRSAVIAYGSLCSLSGSMSSNGRQTSIMVGGLGDRFIGWALPNLRNMHVNNGEAELALEGLREFLNIGDAGGTERYVLPILKACQELLEDERTSLNLLRQLVDILAMISLKFSLSFQSHFLDIVDLLLGWALLPDLLESDRCIILDSFLQFKKHWLGNLQFSLGLLSKFLGDMEAVLQDGTLGTPKQFTRLLPLLSCFLTVLQIIASGMLEINLLNQISSPLEDMLPRLLACLLMVGTRFGWSKWMRECWSCLILFAEILQEKFAIFYTMAFDILFQNSISPAVGCHSMPSFEANDILKTNLQLLSLQKFALLPSAIQKILELNSPMSLLRLHPNFLVSGTLAETYLFLFQHDCNGVVEQAITSLLEELDLLKGMLEVVNVGNLGGGVMAGKLCKELDATNGFSQDELLAVIKFDLKILISCVCLENRKNILDQLEVFSSKCNRSVKFSSFILERINPFKAPFQAFADLQVHIVKALQKLSIVEFESKIFLTKGNKPTSGDPADFSGLTDLHDAANVQIAQYLSKYSTHIVAALHETCPVTVKLEALDWIRRFCDVVMTINGDTNLCCFSNKSYCYCDAKRHASIGTYLLYAVLDATFDREVNVRSQATTILDLLLQACLISHVHFRAVAEVSLEKLGDPCNFIRNGFLRVLSVVLPLTFYIGGMSKDEVGASQKHGVSFIWMGGSSYWHWKQLFAVKQLLRQFKPQQLVSIFSYISQRWKVSLSNWIQRLVFSCQINLKDFIRGQLSNTEELKPDGLWMNLEIGPHILDKICSVNVLAAAWLAIHEAARYCILVRLRTHLGGPTQTFAALERMLMDVAQVLHVDSEHQDGSLNIASNTHLLPMRLLLDFVEALKKNVYNAYDGSSVLPPSTPQSSLFFRANKKVCEEWFARICEPMLNAGLALQCYPATLHYSALRLQDLCNTVVSALKDKNWGQVAESLRQHRAKTTEEVLKVLRYASLAMCRSHEPDALVGLQKWSTITFSSLLQEEFQSMGGYIAGNGQFSWMTGLAYQAQGHYEKAAAHFTHLLQSEEALSSLGSDGVQFTIARVIECYAALSDWKSLESWLLELQGLRATHAGKNYSGALTAAGNEMNAILALARFDEGDVHGSWSYLDLTPKSSTELTIDPKQALQRSEQMLLQAMLHKDVNMDKTVEELKKAELMLEEVLSVVPLDGLNEASAYATQLHCIHIFDEGCKFLRGQKQSSLTSTVPSPLHQVLTSQVSQIHQDFSLWLKVLRVYRTVMPNSAATLQLCLQLITLARKQTNFMLAHHLQQYLMEVLPTCPKCEFMDMLSTNLQYENILLKYAEGKYEDALLSLWSFVHAYMLSPPNAVLMDCDGTLKAKACLKLANWLKQENLAVVWENALVTIRADYLEFNLSNVSIDEHESLMSKSLSDSDVPLDMEEIAGIATKLSTVLCPNMGKAWLSYASWCYHQGILSLSMHPPALQSSSLSSVLSPEVSSGRFALTREEILRVESIIVNFLHNKAKGLKGASIVDEEVIVWSGSEDHLEDSTAMRVLIERAIYLIQVAAGAPGVEDSDGESISSKLAAQLQFLLVNADAAAEKSGILSSVNELVDIWWSLRRRRLSIFGHAAKGFIQYLSMSTFDNKETYLSDNFDMGRQKKDNGTLRAALHVLHILLNYGMEFKDILEHGFSTVSALPWQEITPQLFARVSSHPQQVVRKQLEGLLLTLAKMSPWSIVYPTLVEINACEGEPSEELQHILGCLVKLHPKLVQDVELVINELGAITVLWEEQWLATLQDLHTDVIRRINVLKEEVSRVAENATLSHSEKTKINAAKYSAVMAPIAVALERRLASTSRKPETVHETWFQSEYGERLKSAVSAFKVPPTSAAALVDVWRPFDAIAASLATHQRKPTITLSDVAPQLAHFSASDAPMPGLEKKVTPHESFESCCPDLQGIITISSFCEQVVILSTKTKPKKLCILGSDGKKYTYLLKGREDLRLDARIMQFLLAVKSLLYSCKDAHSQSFFVRHYSVTPISGRAGLIQWVDNVISIYSVFKSWQSRMQIGQVSATGAGNGNAAHPPVPRPSDMFYGKIIPALKEKGIRKVISRRDWPHEVKRKVLLELMKEAPRQLLHREIWCSSEGFKAFNTKLMRYSGSMAAMSMVGYVLGLGDRHLDNILIDFSSGDIVHIDYNVCFDKGQRLKVPEIVPFRLTQTLETALGLTGTEGVFRANCEAVINVLRKNKDILLMLLEVFVWDPLVEWTRGDIHDEAAVGGEERKGMELAVSLSLFASRVQEIRVPLQEHHDLFLSTVPAAVSSLERFADALNRYEVASALFYHADQERSSLLLHESSAKSIVAEATSGSEQKQASFEILACELAQAKAVATEKAQEAVLWMEHHVRVIDALRNGSAPELQAGIRFSTLGEALSLTSAVPAAGIPMTIVPEPAKVQCHDLDNEVAQIIADLDSDLSSSTKSLQTYALALQRILPLNYASSSKVHGWAQLLQLAVNNLSSEILTLARRQAADLPLVRMDKPDYVHQRYEALHHDIESTINEIKRVQEECSELESCIDLETEIKSKDRLLSAFSKYMQSVGHSRKEEEEPYLVSSETKRHDGKDLKMIPLDIEDKKSKVLSVLHLAVIALYNEVKTKVFEISTNVTGGVMWSSGTDALHSNSKLCYCELEEQIEKCTLVASTVHEIHELSGLNISKRGIGSGSTAPAAEGNWASIFQASIQASRNLIEQMTRSVLPEITKSIVSQNSSVMEAFGSLSQIRGSIDTAVEQLVQIELERMSLLELEQNYFMKVGLITEQQLALSEAALKGRDHLSWEEAEELASREEACKAQLDQLHQMWNQKDVHAASVIRRESTARNTIISAEQRFLNVVTVEQGGDLQLVRSRLLLAALMKPFSDLESVDQYLSLFSMEASKDTSINIPDVLSSGYPLVETIWKASGLLKNDSFFIWKLCVVDSFLDSCLHDVSSSLDHNLGFDQLCTVLQLKLELQLQVYLDQYLRERVAPVFLVLLDNEIELLKHPIEESKEFTHDQVKRDAMAVKRVQLMLEEYCNAHETARAARSAAIFMKKHVNELTQNLQKASLELIKMEWLNDLSSQFLQNDKIISHHYFFDDKLSPLNLNLNRHKLLESIRSSMSQVARSLDSLKTCEKTAVLVEGQLERAMGWACAGPNTSSSVSNLSKGSGIPNEFHDHLNRRRQLLQAAKEQATDILKICASVIEFEASRDGIFWKSLESPGKTSDGRAWQQAYLNTMTRLDVSYHSFTRAEQEWRRAQSNMDTATSTLLSATNDLHIASAKADSASGDLHAALVATRESACEASDAVSAFGRVARGHAALTTECGSMVEEVLAISDGIHDVHSLGKEAAIQHKTLMADLAKVNMLLLPLESMLASDVALVIDTVPDETESMIEYASTHGKKICQKYHLRIQEACQSLQPIISPFLYSVRELHAMLMRLAKSANLHAGNLHKALEGLGDSQEVRSQEIDLSRSGLSGDEPLIASRDKDFFESGIQDGDQEVLGLNEFSSPDEEWISPPDSIYSCSTQSSYSCTEGTRVDDSSSDDNPDSTKAKEQLSCGTHIEANEDDSALLSLIDEQMSSSGLKTESHDMEGNKCITSVVATDVLSESRQTSSPSSSNSDSQLSIVYNTRKDIPDIPNASDGKRRPVVDFVKEKIDKNNDPTSKVDSRGWVHKRKNAYALSVLKRVEMKLDGCGIDGDRPLSISEQVDYLLKQATSIDNLCNMYEGWTPWI